jgi:hypothetical protein
LAIFRQSWRERCLDTLMVVNVFRRSLALRGAGAGGNADDLIVAF